MAFCKYCGTQIDEGAVCTCQQAQATANSVQPTETAQPSAAPVQIDKEKIANFSQGLLSHVLGIFKAPVTGAREFVKSGSLAASGIIILLQALLTALIFTVIGGKINDAIPLIEVVPVGKIFVFSLLISLLSGAGYAAILLLLDKTLLKGSSDIRGMSCVSAVNSLMALPLITIALLAAFVMNFKLSVDIGKILSPVIVPSILALTGGVVGKFTAYKALDAGTNISENKKFISFTVSWAIVTLITVFLIKALISSMAEDILPTLFSGIMEQIEDLGSSLGGYGFF